ncbi:hypothetical protein MMC25_005469 [Agyrium rufum]|nr:hypothetical protein [Agyrium rufum]
MDEITGRVKDLLATASEADRLEILLSLRDLAYSIESPDDTMGRILFSHLQLSVVRVAVNLGIFNLLAANHEPSSCKDLARATGAELSLLGPQFQELPKFLADTRYNNITDPNKTVFQSAYKTDLSNFTWLARNPKAFEHLNKHMVARRRGMPTWLSCYPIKQQAQGWDVERALLVDIGGGVGHQCAEFKAKYPDLHGRIILQDLQYSIENALPTPGVEKTVHDFFQPQPVQGAKFYYMRGVLHDFPDEQCRAILQHIVAAMGEQSLILIDDMVLPDTGTHWQATQVDITMMCAFAAMERTQTEWKALLESVGLEIVNRYVYTSGSNESVTVAVPKQSNVSVPL